MHIHDWTKVASGIFHNFHHQWISELNRALNGGILPTDYYALAEQVSGDVGPDILTLEGPTESSGASTGESSGGITLAERQPKVSFRTKTDEDIYAAKANRIAIHHVSGDRMVAVIEIVSPGNKSSRGAVRDFSEKAAELLRQRIHLLIVDLFPPTQRDPQGIHGVIWEEFHDSDFVLPPDRPLTLASYIGGQSKEAFVEPVAVGGALPDMPLFLTGEVYVPAPLNTTYAAAWEAVPRRWKRVLESAPENDWAKDA